MKKLAIPFVLLTALVRVAAMISSGTLNSLLIVAAVILSVIAIPTAWTVIATYMEGRRKKKRISQSSENDTIPSLINCCYYFVTCRWYRHYS
ncbi:hypothetical protein ACFQ4A_04635 [Lentibacillus salinarum]|uniref:Membrane transport protein MMPL domain-containing protein n=1 Tax=Lentibacillus salinarum TaxID=446820 RepID=A0ABW3ZRS2_9BACI